MLVRIIELKTYSIALKIGFPNQWMILKVTVVLKIFDSTSFCELNNLTPFKYLFNRSLSSSVKSYPIYCLFFLFRPTFYQIWTFSVVFTLCVIYNLSKYTHFPNLAYSFIFFLKLKSHIVGIHFSHYYFSIVERKIFFL